MVRGAIYLNRFATGSPPGGPITRDVASLSYLRSDLAEERGPGGRYVLRASITRDCNRLHPQEIIARSGMCSGTLFPCVSAWWNYYRPCMEDENFAESMAERYVVQRSLTDRRGDRDD
jgi:hypothetical protein